MKRLREKDLEKFKTDEERLSVVASLDYDLWDIVAQWEEEAKTEKARNTFRNYRISMYHKEEYSCYGEL